jgi:YggT family protein
MQSLYQAIMLILNVVFYVMIAHIILSWLISFQVLNTRQPIVAQIWYGLNRMLEPIYGPIRRFLPVTAGLDFAPLVAFIALMIIQQTLANNAGWFYSF